MQMLCLETKDCENGFRDSFNPLIPSGVNITNFIHMTSFSNSTSFSSSSFWSSSGSLSSSSVSSTSSSSSSTNYPSYSDCSCSYDGCGGSCIYPENPHTVFPVRYHDGQIQMTVNDIELHEGAVDYVHKRKYDNLKFGEKGLNGFGWQVDELPTAVCLQEGFQVQFTKDDCVRFSLQPDALGICSAHDSRPDTLKIDSATKTLLVTRDNGIVWTFSNDPNGSIPQGLPISVAADNGKITEFIYQNRRLFKVVTSHQNQRNNILAELEYTYNSEGLLAAITLRQGDDKVLKPVERVLYSYYTDEDTCGNAGDLKTVVTEMAVNDSWVPAQTYCYRYYKDGDMNGPKHALKMAFFPADFELFTQKNGNVCQCSISDADALEFATKYYEYDAKQRVILERVDRNRKLITLEYTEYPDTNDRNAVHRKTVETGPFGERNIVFTNNHGQVLLREEVAPPGTEEPSAIYYFRYNGDGVLTHRYSAGVVLGYTVVTGMQTTLALDLSSDKGMIEISEYHGNWYGAKEMSFRKTIQNGTEGTPIVLEERQYVNHNVNGKPRWRVKQDTRFADEEAKSAIATSYQYELFPGTDKVLQQTTILPAIPKEQNGTGIAGTIVERFDEKERLIWSKDELGIIGFNQYDSITGQMVKSIQDVDTARTADFNVEVPQGWATASNAGKHLVTEFEYDSRGRMTQVLHPENESVDENNNVIIARKAEWTVYDDARRRTMHTSGYVVGEKVVLVNPVSITITGAGGKVLEEITAARDTVEGRLLVTDKFPQSSYVSWTKHFYEGGNRIATRVYTTIPPTGEGVQGKNYEETVFLHDEFGRQNLTIAPNGLITKQKLNWHGHALEVWQGDDESSLCLMSEMVYGGEGACHTCSGRGGKPRIVIRHVDDNTMRIAENTYDWRGRLIETFGEEDANGQFISTKNTYDNLDRVVKTEQFVNDALEGRLVATSEMLYTPLGGVWCQSSTAADPKTGEFVETKKSLTWFDIAGRCIKSQSACQCVSNVNYHDSLGRTVKTAVLGKNGEVLQETDQIYDNAGNVIQTISAEFSATSKKDFMRKQFSAQWFDPTGRSVASAQFGTNGGKEFRREKTVPGTGLVTRTIYDAATGLDAAQIDAAGRTTVFTYDATRRRVKESLFVSEGRSRKLVRETCSQVDVRRGVTRQIDALGNITKSIADVFGRTVAQIDALGNRTEMVYNRTGELLEQRDPMGRVTRFIYDNLGRRVETILPAPKPGKPNPVQKIVYDALGRIVQQVDPLGHTAAMEYDAHGRVVRQVNAEGGVTSFAYTDAGQLKSLTDPVGNTTTYEYDDLARPIRETNELGKSRSFEYLAGRLMAKKTDRNGRATTFEHDDFGRVTAEKWFEADKVVKTLAFDYDLAGHLTKVDDGVTTFDYSRDEDGRELMATMNLPGLETPIVQQTEYDILGRRTQIATVFGNEMVFANQYAYTKTGQMESISQGGKRVKYHYDAAGMRTATQLFSHGNEVITTLQTFDGMGRLTSIDHQGIVRFDYSWDTANRIVSMNDAKYGYDATSQLTSAVYDKLPAEAYLYDANGNRQNFETGKNNQLTSDGTFEYTYDGEGNRVSKVSKNSKTEYVWDHRNRLVKVIDNGKSVEYDYDYLNRLVRRNDELFVHDGWQVACSLKNGKIERRYLWGAVQDELLAIGDNWALRDHLNTVRKVVNAKGKVISTLEYNAFGKLVNATGDKPLFRYTGKMFDDSTGLQWNINRWYDANVGRWISEDPIGFRGRDWNLLRYVANRVLVAVDAKGLFLCSFCPPTCGLMPIGFREDFTVTDWRVMDRFKGHPNAVDIMLDLIEATQLLGTVLDALGFVGGAFQSLTAMLEVILDIGVGISISGPLENAINQAIQQLIQQIPSAPTTAAVAIWVKVNFKACRTTRGPCCVCTKRHWNQEHAWYRTDLGPLSTINNVTLLAIVSSVNNALARAKNNEPGDTTS